LSELAKHAMLGESFGAVQVTRSSGVNGLEGVRSERRIKFAADELPLDILALLVSCGHHIRAEDAQILKRRSGDAIGVFGKDGPP